MSSSTDWVVGFTSSSSSSSSSSSASSSSHVKISGKKKRFAEYVAPQADLLKLQNRNHLPSERGMGATMPLAQQVMLDTVLRN
jgi:hypothetical protein